MDERVPQATLIVHTVKNTVFLMISYAENRSILSFEKLRTPKFITRKFKSFLDFSLYRL